MLVLFFNLFFLGNAIHCLFRMLPRKLALVGIDVLEDVLIVVVLGCVSMVVCVLMLFTVWCSGLRRQFILDVVEAYDSSKL